MTPQIQQLQTNKLMNDFQRQVTISTGNVSALKGMAMADSVLGPLQGMQLSRQLADPSTGPDATAVVQRFADQLVEVLKPTNEEKSAVEVSNKLGEVRRARQGRRRADPGESERLMSSIMGLQARVERR